MNFTSRFRIFLFTLLTFLIGRSDQLISQQYSFVPYSVEDGLAQTQVFAIRPDSVGNIWFGTGGGVSQFDGVNFTNYSTENGLVDHRVVQIISHNGFVWIATQSGISRFRGKQTEQYPLKEEIEKNRITCFDIDGQNAWVGVRNVGVIQIPLKNGTLLMDELTIHKPIDKLNPRGLFIDQNNRIWVGAEDYLGYWNGRWNKVEIPNSKHDISGIAQDSRGKLWISTYFDGVYSIDGDQINNYRKEDGLISDLVRSIFIDNQDRVWLSSKIGATLIEKDQIRTFSEKNGLSNENVKVISQDKESNIWFGSEGSGALKFAGDEFVNYSKDDGLASNYIMSIVQDQSNDYWFCTYGEGLNHYKNGEFTQFKSFNSGLSNNTTWSSLCDHTGKLWFGTSDGLTTYENGVFTPYKNTDWLPSNRVTSLYEDSNHRIWIGTSKGITINDHGKMTTFTNCDGKDINKVRSILEYNNSFWIGTNGGILIYKDGELHAWRHNDILKNSNVFCMEKSDQSNLFIGTGNGLYHFNGMQLRPIDLHPSFSANFINFITLEGSKYLWVGTNYGIFEIDLLVFGSSPSSGIIHHTTSDGLKSVETNLNAAYVDHEGKIWMGTGNGMIKFDRSRRTKNQKVTLPVVKINEVQLFLRKTDWSKYSEDVDPYTLLPKNVSVSHRKNYFTFFFNAKSISRPKELRYRIKLEGFDPEWSPVLKQESFTYTNLPYGTFKFQVIASIDGKNWSVPSEFTFTIQKPYYLQWWFFGLCGLAALTILFLIWKWRSRIHERKRVTESLVYKSRLLALEQQSLNASMNRHFIFNALNSIQYYINTNDKLAANRYLTSFAKLIRKNLDSSSSGNSLVTLRDELERLELYISLEHMRFQNKFSYSINIAPEVDTESIKVPPMFLQPFVENSIWHGILPMEESGNISIQIGKNAKNHLQFIIEDNGIGVDVSLERKSEHSHVSKGMILTSGRIDVLKKVTKQNFVIEGPFQLFDEKNNSLGTRVVITLEE